MLPLPVHQGLIERQFAFDQGDVGRSPANIEGEDVSIVLLNSFGKLTPFGDSNRLRKWMLGNS